MNRILVSLALLSCPLSAVALADADAAAPERIALWTSGKAPGEPPKFEDGSGFITVHRPAKPNGAAMIICPGGSYGGLMREPEGHGIARWLNQYGITGIVLEYRLPQGRANVPLLDAQRAIRLVRSKAKEWGVDPHRVGIIGFSAGGHLAASLSVHNDAGDPLAADLIDRGIIMAGGGSLLRGLDKLLAEETGLPVHVSENPVTAVATGVGRSLDNIRYLRTKIAVSAKTEL